VRRFVHQIETEIAKNVKWIILCSEKENYCSAELSVGDAVELMIKVPYTSVKGRTAGEKEENLRRMLKNGELYLETKAKYSLSF